MKGAIVCLVPPPDVAGKLAIPDGEALDQLHVTLVFLGDASTLDAEKVQATVQQAAADLPPFTATISGAGIFTAGHDPAERPLYASIDAPELPRVREGLRAALQRALGDGVLPTEHGFSPHMTLAYVGRDATVPDLQPLTWRCTSVGLWIGNERTEIPLTGKAFVFAHPPEHRAAGLAAVKQHGSLRKAAAATGLPKSTLHDWTKANTDDVLGDEPSAGELEIIGSTGVGDAPDLGLTDDGADTGPDQASATLPEDLYVQGPEPTDPRPGDPLWLRAFHRYVSLLANGVHPDHALYAAQQIDADFELDEDEDAAVQQAIPGLMPDAELAMTFAAKSNPPPAYVGDTYDAYAFNDADISTLGDHLYSAMVDSYTDGINQHLTALKADPVTAVADPDVLKGLRENADASAQSIAANWNRDLASTIGKSWLDVSDASRVKGENLRSTEGRKAEIDAAAQEWMDGRADWKPTQWALDASSAAFSQATQDFMANNDGAVVSLQVQPDACVCSGCQDLVDIGPLSPEDAAGLDLPLHSGCDHGLEATYSVGIDADSLWTGQSADDSEDEAQTA